MKIVEEEWLPSRPLFINAITAVNLNGKVCDDNRIPKGHEIQIKLFLRETCSTVRSSIILRALLNCLKYYYEQVKTQREHWIIRRNCDRNVTLTPKSAKQIDSRLKTSFIIRG